MEEIPIWFHPIPHLLQNNLRKLAIAPDRWLATRQYHPFQAHCLQSEIRDSKMPWHFAIKKPNLSHWNTTKKCNFASSCDFLDGFLLTHFWPWKIWKMNSPDWAWWDSTPRGPQLSPWALPSISAMAPRHHKSGEIRKPNYHKFKSIMLW